MMQVENLGVNSLGVNSLGVNRSVAIAKTLVATHVATLAAILAAITLALTLSTSASAQQIVNIDSGLAEKSGYMIFRWQKAPEFSSQIDEKQNLRLVFAQKAQRFEVGKVQERLKAYLKSVNVIDRQRISVALKRNVLVSTRKTRDSIVVYFQLDKQSEKIPGRSARAERATGETAAAMQLQQVEERIESSDNTPFLVKLEAQRRSGYQRISFAWPTDVLFRSEILTLPDQKGDIQETLVVTFDKNMIIENATAKIRALAGTLGTPSFQKNGREIRIPLLRKVTMRDFAYGNRVVIDLFANQLKDSNIAQSDPDTKPSAVPSSPQLPAVTVRGGRHGDYTRFIFDYNEPTKYLIERTDSRLAITFNRSNPLDLRTLGFSPRENFAPARTQRFANRNIFSIPLPQENEYRHFVSGTRIVVDVLHTVTLDRTPLPDIIGVSAPLVATSPPLPQPLIFDKEGKNLGSKLPSAEEIAAGRPAPVFQFQLLLPEGIATAFFRRAGFIWFIADRPFQIDTQSQTQNAQTALGGIEQIPNDNFTILRFTTAQQLYPATRQVGLSWWLEFHDTPIDSYFNINTAITQDSKAQAEFNFLLNKYGKVLQLRDPEIGDDIFVIPVQNPSLGINRARAYPEFQILESAQGVAFVPLANNIKLDRLDGRAIIKAPDGLQLETFDVDQVVSERTPEELIRLPILNFDLWARPDKSLSESREVFNSMRLRDVSENRSGFNLNLAGYYLSQGLAQEALGLLNLFSSSFTSNNLTPRLMRAVALLLAERTDEAIEVLRAPVFDRLQEANLWRGVAAAQKKQAQLAELYFEQAGNFFDLYPDPVKAAIAVWRIDNAIATDNTAAAEAWLKRVEKIALGKIPRRQVDAFAYMRGALAQKRGNDKRALKIFRALHGGAKTGYWQVRANLDALVLARDIEETPKEEVLTKLERLNQAWRGDELAFQIQKELGTTYGLNGFFYQQLKIYREAITQYPLFPETAELSKQMVELFQDLFLLREGVPLSPVEAYLIHENFKELIPTGEKGLLLTESAVGRISQGSFYKIAADIAKNAFVDNATKSDKDRLIVKTGLLFLLAGQAQEALNVLDKNTPPQGSPYGDDARRLRARAHVELKQSDYALRLLAGDVSEVADLLRFAIHRNNADWEKAAASLQRLLGPPPRQEGVRLSQRKASFLIYLAATLYLAEETEALDGIARDYAETIEDSPLLEVFNFLTQANDPNRPVSITQMVERLQESSDTNIGFLDAYRQRFLR